MSDIDKKLYEYLGSKELSFGLKLYDNASAIAHYDAADSYGYTLDTSTVWTLINVRTSNGEPWGEIINEHGSCEETLLYEFDPENDSDWKDRIQIIGHEPTIFELHKWMNENQPDYAIWDQDTDCIVFHGPTQETVRVQIPYDSSLPLLDQSEETKKVIISLIESHGT